MKRLITLAALLAVSFAASAELSVKEPCSNGMVLQQNTTAAIWGHASPGVRVSVTTGWDGRTYLADTDGKGIWKTGVSTPEASYAKYEIKIKGDGRELTISDVLVGEVWIASGQSNMEMPVIGYFNCPVEGSAEIIANTRLRDKVRMFSVKQDQSEALLDDVRNYTGWVNAEGYGVAWMSATAFFFARYLQQMLDVPVGIVALPYGGSRVESWLPREILERFGEPLDKTYEWHYHYPYKMYNAMQHPIQGYTAKGFIWYQGCSNVGFHEQFVERMSAMVERWRKDWGDKDALMPFYQVEIAPYIDYGGVGALLRKAQHKAAEAIPNGGIVVTNDLVYPYETDQIHPCRKREVGERLAYLALNRDYGYSFIACLSPEATEIFRPDNDPSAVCVRLSNTANGLDRWNGIEGLEVAGEDGEFKPVTTAYFDWQGHYLTIRHPEVAVPREVRYGWGDFRPGNLHNPEGLPVSPFDIKL